MLFWNEVYEYLLLWMYCVLRVYVARVLFPATKVLYKVN